MQVWKCPAQVQHNKIQTITHSWDGGLLSVKVQNNRPVIYFMNSPDKDQEFRTEIKAVFTGAEYNEIGWEYVDTCLLDEGDFVVHYFKKV